MVEVWKNIKVREGYQVSSYGRVRKGTIIVKGSVSRYGYRRISLGRLGENLAHILVAETFELPKPETHQRIVVDHIDHDKLNNQLTNLRYITNAQNIGRSQQSRYGVQTRERRNKKYRARIAITGIGLVNIGSYLDKEEAYGAFFATYKERYGYAPWGYIDREPINTLEV